MTPPVEIVAHRGASADAPENTLAAVELAWAQQADAVEVWTSFPVVGTGAGTFPWVFHAFQQGAPVLLGGLELFGGGDLEHVLRHLLAFAVFAVLLVAGLLAFHLLHALLHLLVLLHLLLQGLRHGVRQPPVDQPNVACASAAAAGTSLRRTSLTADAAEWASIMAGNADPRAIAVAGRGRGDAARAAEFFRTSQVPWNDVHY